MKDFNFTPQERKHLFEKVLEKLEGYYQHTSDYPVSPALELSEIWDYARSANFDQPAEPLAALLQVIKGLEKYAVHTPHPKYFGLFNPRTNFPSILADLITATLNPQMAAWSHSPFAVEAEAYVIHELGIKFGLPVESIDGVFAAGGAEANLTAVLCALNNTFPDFTKEGVFALPKRPIIYGSLEGHHSIQKAAKTVGLGYASVHSIPVNTQLQMEPEALRAQLMKDLEAGYQPFLLVATAGTTGTGALDPLPELHAIAQEFGLWFHVDAAYGGGAMLNTALRPSLTGIELADSITFDAHKWMSVPMGTSVFLTPHKHILSQTFSIATDYMPKEAQEMEIVDPYGHSIQWSRRFIGLRVYLSLMIFGWEGYDQIIGHQTTIGHYLRKKLQEQGWKMYTDTPLPVICFSDPRFEKDPAFTKGVAREVVSSGSTWISVYPVHGISTLRACITNYSTTEADIDSFVADVNRARELY